MIETLIMKQPLEVREKSEYDEVRINIPTALSLRTVELALKEELTQPGFSDSRAFMVAVTAERPRVKSTLELINNKGR